MYDLRVRQSAFASLMIWTNLRVLLFIAVGCLVLNDVARLVCPALQQAVYLLNDDAEQDEENVPFSTSNLLEEEVKHHETNLFPQVSLWAEEDSARRKSYRIQDDDLPVLAFIAVFSPPPDRA